MSSCLPTPSSESTAYTLSAASQLPTTGVYSSASRDAFVRRNGTRLEVDVQGSGVEEFKVVGPNVYWLGLDENVDPSPSYPTKGRILEAMAIASAMGATTIRSQSLGISFGTGLSIENALNTFKPEGNAAWDAIDFAVYAARRYNLRLILPLTDQYDYYHGGIPTFLRWRNLSDSDFSPFYNTASEVYSDFTTYVRTLLTHVSPYTNLSLATDPTVLAFETGNELGGWTGKHYPPPVRWTESIAQLLKELAPQTLVLSGSYGVRKEELGISEVDMHSDHFYPLYTSRLSSSASLAHSAHKPFLAGEYDWTNSLYNKLRWAWWAMALPVVIAAVVAWVGCGPRRWWPVRTTVRGVLSCGGCGRERRNRRREKRVRGGEEVHEERDELSRRAHTPESYGQESEDFDKSLFASSTSALPILSSSTSTIASTSFPPPPLSRRPPSSSSSSSWLDRPFLLHKWHLSLLILLIFLPLLGALLHVYLPDSISAFLSSLEDLTSSSSKITDESTKTSNPKSVGDLYWSLFGRDSACCHYVQHADGYTLHYPSVPSLSSGPGSGRGSGGGVLRLTKHAWEVRGERPHWLGEGKEVGEIGFGELPVVACPQEELRLGNGTVVGGRGS
ncbi:hypothetical protein JCM11251_000571 [Rhodosporidiobolus azoricus]